MCTRKLKQGFMFVCNLALHASDLYECIRASVSVYMCACCLVCMNMSERWGDRLTFQGTSLTEAVL